MSMLAFLVISKKIVQPLQQLTDIAININKTTGIVHSSQDINKKLEQIKSDGKIGELVFQFKKMIQGLSGSQSIVSQRYTGKQKVQYPKNFFYQTKMPWRDQFQQKAE